MLSLIGKEVELTNINPSLYKWNTKGIVEWQSDKFVKFKDDKSLYSINNVRITKNVH